MVTTGLSTTVDVQQLQKKDSGALRLLYHAVNTNTTLDPVTVSLGGHELKKYSQLISLMYIDDSGVLKFEKVRNPKHSTKISVTVCPTSIREKVAWDIHNLSHSGMTATLKRLQLTWYWPGMVNDVRRLIACLLYTSPSPRDS